MACFYPLSGWQSSTVNPSGKRSVVFDLKSGLVDRPVEVPCGKCTGCRADQALMWSIRAYHESTLHDRNSFLTLTYSDDKLPSDGKIVKADLQKFFKRLRHFYKVRYIACGEYGEQTRRPHYHAIIFGQDFDEAPHRFNISDKTYSNTLLESIWRKGHVVIAEVNMSTIMYTCGYVNKKIGDADTFQLCSRRPFIGSNWLKQFRSDIKKTGSVTIEGREYVVPSRYLDTDEVYFKEVKRERKERALQAKSKLTGPLALRNKEKNRNSQIKQKREKL